MYVIRSYYDTLVSLNKVHLGVNSGITPMASANKMHMNVLQTSDSLVWLAIYTEGLGRYDPFSEDPVITSYSIHYTKLYEVTAQSPVLITNRSFSVKEKKP